MDRWIKGTLFRSLSAVPRSSFLSMVVAPLKLLHRYLHLHPRSRNRKTSDAPGPRTRFELQRSEMGGGGCREAWRWIVIPLGRSWCQDCLATVFSLLWPTRTWFEGVEWNWPAIQGVPANLPQVQGKTTWVTYFYFWGFDMLISQMVKTISSKFNIIQRGRCPNPNSTH